MSGQEDRLQVLVGAIDSVDETVLVDLFGNDVFVPKTPIVSVFTLIVASV